jgi:hypothetical protein
MGGVEYLYDILADSEYPDVITRSNLRVSLGQLTEGQHAAQLDRLARTPLSLMKPSAWWRLSASRLWVDHPP